jgi:hypothetical protein
MARPKTKIHWGEVASMIKAGNAGTDVAAHLGVHPDTLYRQCKDQNGITFQEFVRKSLGGNSLGSFRDRVRKEEKGKRRKMAISGTGYVYIVKCGEFDYYKIGVSKINVQARISVIQSGCPFEIKLIGQYHTERYLLIERKIHKSLKTKNIRGEWFLLSQTELNEIVKQIECNTTNQLQLAI